MKDSRKDDRRRKALVGCGAAAAMLLASSPVHAVITSTTLQDVGQMIGANTFYNAGFTGTGTIVGNIEGGLVWDGHEELTGATTEFPASGQFDRHATWVGGTLAGDGATVTQRGIAYGSTLWSGAVATSWNLTPGSFSLSFNLTLSSFLDPYQTALVDGVTTGNVTQTADVINSSWTRGNGANGLDSTSQTIDALAALTGKTIVFASGDTGPTTDTVTGPASGQNVIVVGASQFDSSNDTYDSVASFSGRSPSSFFLPNNASATSGTTLIGVRAMVDLVAPGTTLVAPFYGGATGGNAGNTPNLANNLFNTGIAGTSFSAPMVAGGAALVVEAGKSLFPNDPKAIDGRVIKAVLMNSATPLAGWNNGQSLNAQNVIVTSQSLDYSQGAGELNLTNAYSQYIAGTADLPSRTGGSIAPVGWTYGTITHSAAGEAVDKYPIASTLTAGSEMRVTLDWFSNQSFTPDQVTSAFGDFDNLDLQVWNETGTPTLVAESNSLYNSAELLDFVLPTSGVYDIRVIEDNYVYNFDNGVSTDFGLAWSVPEPGALTLMLAGAIGLLGRRRRRVVD